jgi:hypothetical protein
MLILFNLTGGEFSGMIYMDYGVWEVVVIYCQVIFNNILLLQNLSLDNSYQPIPLISCFTSGRGVGIGNLSGYPKVFYW